MLIFGHPWIESKKFSKVFTKSEIEHIPAEDIILLEPLNASIDIAHYCIELGREYAVVIGSIREALIANALGVSYAVCNFEQAIVMQKVANEYMFDTKILVLIDDEKGIETNARFGIDGVIFPDAVMHRKQ